MRRFTGRSRSLLPMILVAATAVSLIAFGAGGAPGANQQPRAPAETIGACLKQLAKLESNAKLMTAVLTRVKRKEVFLIQIGHAYTPIDAGQARTFLTLELLAGSITPKEFLLAIRQLASETRRNLTSLIYDISGLTDNVKTQKERCDALKQAAPPKPPPPPPPPPPPATGSLVLTPPITVDPPQHREWTIDLQGGTATWTHCCDGGKWAIEYTFEVPQALSPGHSYPIKLGMNVTSYESGGPSLFSIGARNEWIQDADPNLSVNVNGALRVAKTLTLYVPASAKDAKDEYILVGFGGYSVTYHYQRAGA